MGIVGAGQIGRALTMLLARAGHEVWLANSRGPESLGDVVAPLGERVHAAMVPEAVQTAELVVVSVPVGSYRWLPSALFAGMVVDTGNYDPQRDGPIPELEAGRTTEAEMLAAGLPMAAVVKMFNTIYHEHLRDQSRVAGSAGRRALPMAGDDRRATSMVMAVVDEIGFDTVDVGPLSAARRLGRDSPVFDVRFDASGLRAVLDL